MGNLCVCDCPDNLFKERDVTIDNMKYHTDNEYSGLLNSHSHRSKTSMNKQSSTAKQVPFLLNSINVNSEPLNIEDNNNADSLNQSRKSSLSKL